MVGEAGGLAAGITVHSRTTVPYSITALLLRTGRDDAVEQGRRGSGGAALVGTAPACMVLLLAARMCLSLLW